MKACARERLPERGTADSRASLGDRRLSAESRKPAGIRRGRRRVGCPRVRFPIARNFGGAAGRVSRADPRRRALRLLAKKTEPVSRPGPEIRAEKACGREREPPLCANRCAHKELPWY